MSHTYKYERPALTVDCVIFGLDLDEQHLKVMLIERDVKPFAGRWAIPGGFVRRGETLEQAAARELREETGIDGVEIGPCVWLRERPVRLEGELVVAHERYYLVRSDRRAVSLAGLTEGERRVYRDHAWWSPDEMRASPDVFLPLGLPDLLDRLAAGDVPETPLRVDS